jgi:hypothetical protein
MTTTPVSPVSPASTPKRGGGSKGPRPAKPKFLVEGLVPTKKVSFELKVTALETIEAYASFLCTQSGYTVTPAAIVERLADELGRDKSFRAHLESLKGTSRPGAALKGTPG